MQNKPQIAILHPNSLCCLAMRTILTDIAPFMGLMSEVEIATYNTMEEFEDDGAGFVVHYFVAAEIVESNINFFLPLARRCIVLTEGGDFSHPEFHTVNMHQPEREVLKGVLMMHRAAHAAMMSAPRPEKEEAELLSQREKEVLALIIKGFINKEIADKLNISTPTVIFHRRNIMEKIGSKSIGRLTIYAVMNGIVDAKEL
ncbi:MAG: helix-turn-helix transcriptional regulator [Rikenellaceae bacterium]|nr:helix-turn-helix transcriptional regulator [Rikenellaceae bacterium]